METCVPPAGVCSNCGVLSGGIPVAADHPGGIFKRCGGLVGGCHHTPPLPPPRHHCLGGREELFWCAQQDRH